MNSFHKFRAFLFKEQSCNARPTWYLNSLVIDVCLTWLWVAYNPYKNMPNVIVESLFWFIRKRYLFLVCASMLRYCQGKQLKTIRHCSMCSIESTVDSSLQKTHGVWDWYLLAVWNPLKTNLTQAAWTFGGRILLIKNKFERVEGATLKLCLDRPWGILLHLVLHKFSNLTCREFGAWKWYKSTSYNSLLPSDTWCIQPSLRASVTISW